LRQKVKSRLRETVGRSRVVVYARTPAARREFVVGIIAWIIVGLIAGAIAKLVVPGTGRMGCLGTIVLGLVGSIIGGLLGDLIQPGNQRFEPAGILGSIIGAVIALLALRAAQRRRGGPFRRSSRW
jgi:uncharacterized membrane protein YeaQ/YmgE (transglycosylase-associated protein family)